MFGHDKEIRMVKIGKGYMKFEIVHVRLKRTLPNRYKKTDFISAGAIGDSIL